MYETALGVSDENSLGTIPWAVWRIKYGAGTQETNRPTEWAISPSGEICLGQIPNAIFTLRGEYQKSAQTLVADADVPEMPARFHNLIRFRAMLLLAEHDEAEIAMAVTLRKEREAIGQLERDQLPALSRMQAGPLA